jgi:rubrerythrin
MKWACKVCGKPIESDSRPIACPLCGANGEYIVLEKDFKGFPQKLEERSKENLNAALNLERNATQDYIAYAKECNALGDAEAATMFEALAKVESGHQIAIRKMLSLKK